MGAQGKKKQRQEEKDLGSRAGIRRLGSSPWAHVAWGPGAVSGPGSLPHAPASIKTPPDGGGKVKASSNVEVPVVLVEGLPASDGPRRESAEKARKAEAPPGPVKRIKI